MEQIKIKYHNPDLVKIEKIVNISVFDFVKHLKYLTNVKHSTIGKTVKHFEYSKHLKIVKILILK